MLSYSITEDMKRSIDEQKWMVYTHVIRYRKTAREVSHEKYFLEKFIDVGLKINELYVYKNLITKWQK